MKILLQVTSLAVWLIASDSPAGTVAPLIRYEVHSWQSDEGLAHNSVRAIAQTTDGFLWVGTEGGLARFDGLRFLPIGDAFPPLQNSRMINTLLATGDGALWIGSEGGGLVEWKDGQCRSFFGNTHLPGAKVRCLAQSRDGTIWIGTEQGLAKLKDGSATRIAWPGGAADIAVNAIAEDQRGFIRIATRNGLFTLKPDGTFSADNAGIGPISYGLRTVFADRDGNLWFGGPGGLRYIRVSEEQPVVHVTELLQQVISAVAQDHTGQRWVGTARGIVRMSGNRVLGWPLNEAGAGDTINTILEDREGNLWVGGRDGLYRLKPARFTTYAEKDGLSANDVRAVCEDRSGAIWVAGWLAGLNRIEAGQISKVRSTNGLTDDAVLALHPASDGGLWVGMDWGRGLNKLNDRQTNTLPPLPGLINAPIRTLLEARDGTLWIGTGKGLNVWRSNRLETFTATNGLPGNIVLTLLEDRNHNLWIGTDRGLARWDGKSFRAFTVADGLSVTTISSLYEDGSGALWIGTRSRGLHRFQDGKFTAYTTAQGLFSDDIIEAWEDGNGYFWITCRRGLFRINKREFTALDRDEVKTLNCTVFSRQDGLASLQFNGDAKPAGLKASDGRLWLPTVRGVVVVDTRLVPNPLPPTTCIEEVLADRQLLRRPTTPATADEIVVVPPGTRDLEIRFTALSLQSPERSQFRYRLEGVDESWVEAGVRRSVNYTLLRPGTYRFHVLGSNNDGIWSETEAVLGIHLEPHFWQTWWFKATIVAALTLALIGAYRLRVARLRELERLRIRIASDLHDDVGSRLTKMAMLTEMAGRETLPADRHKLHIQTIASTVQEIIRAMDEIVWTINPRNDTLDDLANYIFHYAQDFFQHTPIRCRLDLPAQLPRLHVSTEQRHNLFMAIKEALNNAAKHSQASEVRISLHCQDSHLRIVIADNGRGMDLAQGTTGGDGLKNMRDRLRQIRGRLHLDSAPGRGTTITMELRGRHSRSGHSRTNPS